MIAERLDSAKIVFGLNGEIAGAIDQLSAHSQLPTLGRGSVPIRPINVTSVTVTSAPASPCRTCAPMISPNPS